MSKKNMTIYGHTMKIYLCYKDAVAKRKIFLDCIICNTLKNYNR